MISSSEAGSDSDLEGATALAMLVGSGSDDEHDDADGCLHEPSAPPRTQNPSPSLMSQHSSRPPSPNPSCSAWPDAGISEAHGQPGGGNADAPSSTMLGHGGVIHGNIFNPVVNVYGSGSTNVSLTYVEAGGDPRATVTVQAPVTPGARRMRTQHMSIPSNANVLIRDTDPNDIASVPSASEGGPTAMNAFSQLGQGLNTAGKRKRQKRKETVRAVRQLRRHFEATPLCGWVVVVVVGVGGGGATL